MLQYTVGLYVICRMCWNKTKLFIMLRTAICCAFVTWSKKTKTSILEQWSVLCTIYHRTNLLFSFEKRKKRVELCVMGDLISKSLIHLNKKDIAGHCAIIAKIHCTVCYITYVWNITQRFLSNDLVSIRQLFRSRLVVNKKWSCSQETRLEMYNPYLR